MCNGLRIKAPDQEKREREREAAFFYDFSNLGRFGLDISRLRDSKMSRTRFCDSDPDPDLKTS